MTAFLVRKGMRLNIVGISRGISNGAGLCGTFVFHQTVKSRSVCTTGMCSIVMQFACLSISFLSIFVHDTNLSLTMLVVGVCASRVGLWSFDLAFTQLYQQNIPEHFRGVVGGVQESLNAFFEVCTFMLGLVFSDPNDFDVLIKVGFCSVAAATFCFWLGVYRRQGSIQ